MLKKDITYKDLDGNDITETFWFHLSRAELAKLAIGKEGKAGGFDVWVRNLINSNDGEVLVENFEKILLTTIGERSEDNKRFIKTDEIRNNFFYSDAYSILFMEIMLDTDKMTEFINGVVPKDMSEEVGKTMKEISDAPDISTAIETLKGPQARMDEKRFDVAVSAKDTPDWLKEGRVPTEQELKGASHEHILEAFKLRSKGSGEVTQEEISGS